RLGSLSVRPRRAAAGGGMGGISGQAAGWTDATGSPARMSPVNSGTEPKISFIPSRMHPRPMEHPACPRLRGHPAVRIRRHDSAVKQRSFPMLEQSRISHPSDSATGLPAKRVVDSVQSFSELPDLLLVERTRGRDNRAFETLMRRYNRRLYRIARSIL